MFFRYVVAKIPNRKFHDVLLHAGANVCLHLEDSSSSASESADFQQQLPKSRMRGLHTFVFAAVFPLLSALFP